VYKLKAKPVSEMDRLMEEMKGQREERPPERKKVSF
jgi:hypothetical protein